MQGVKADAAYLCEDGVTAVRCHEGMKGGIKVRMGWHHSDLFLVCNDDRQAGGQDQSAGVYERWTFGGWRMLQGFGVGSESAAMCRESGEAQVRRRVAERKRKRNMK